MRRKVSAIAYPSPLVVVVQNYVQFPYPHSNLFTSSTYSPIDLLIIIASDVPKTIDTTPLPLRGPCKVVTSHISIIVIIVITVPLGSFALSLALRIYLFSGAGAADGLRTLVGCRWLKAVIRCRSWNPGGSSRI